MAETVTGQTVLVTGASGFIGSHLAHRLLREGADVYLLLRPGTDAYRIRDIVGEVHILQADLRDYEAVRQAVCASKPRRIYHLAAVTEVGRSPQHTRDVVAVNLQGTLNLLHALEDVGYDSFVNTGTCEEYGGNPPPFREDQPVDPVSPYSASKSAAWLFCQMYHRALGWPIVTVRPFTVIGPGQNPRMLVSQVILAALQHRDFPMTKGEQTREFNYVDDIVEGYIRASTMPAAIGETINLGSSREHRVRDVVLQILDLMGNPIEPQIGALPYREREQWRLFCDNSKALRLLNWCPQISLAEALQRTVAWFEAEWRAGRLPARNVEW